MQIEIFDIVGKGSGQSFSTFRLHSNIQFEDNHTATQINVLNK